MITFEMIRNNKSLLREVDGVEGIYKVYIPKEIAFHMNNFTTAIESYKGKNLSYDSIEKIQDICQQWELIQKANEPDDRLIYIGQSTNLKERLRNFAAYGVGKSKAHRGGKILWQLTDAMKFQLEYYPYKNSAEEKKRLIADFKERHFGLRPIANEK